MTTMSADEVVGSQFKLHLASLGMVLVRKERFDQRQARTCPEN